MPAWALQVGIGVECSLEQLLGTGLLHADPHPGNLLYTHEGKLAYLDFGLLCRMERQHQAAMLGAIAHLVNGEWSRLTEDLAAMDVLKPATDRNAVTMVPTSTPSSWASPGIPSVDCWLPFISQGCLCTYSVPCLLDRLRSSPMLEDPGREAPGWHALAAGA